MKRKLWWTLLGLPSVGLAALVSQSVWGQPDTTTPYLPLPPMVQSASHPNDLLPKDVTPKDVTPKDVTPKPGAEAMPLEVVPNDKLPTFQTPPSPLPPPGVEAPQPVMPLPPTTSHSSPIVKAASFHTDVANAKNNDPINYNVAPGKQQTAVSVEWVGPQAVRLNQPMNCQLVVRNTSTSLVQNVIVRHALGQGVISKRTEPQAIRDGNDLVWHLGSLAPDQARKIDLLVTAQTRGVLNCNAAVTFTAVSVHHVHVREPMLAIKMRTADKVIAGENVTLLFAISNPGDGATEGIKVKTTLPDGLETARGRNIEFDVGSLAPNETRTMQMVCLAKGSGMQKCTSTASADGNLTASDATQFEILSAKLDVALSGPKLRYLDRHAIYVLKVSNPGNAVATNVEVNELIPPGFKFHQANLGGKFQDATRVVTWSLGDLQPGQTKDVAVDLIPIEPGEHRLLAQAKATRGLKVDAETRTIVEGLPSLSIDVTHLDDPIEVGAENAFEIRVVNTGTKMESNVQVVCTLPEQLAFIAAKCSTTLRFRQEGQQLIFEPLAKLAPKADVIYRVQVKGVAAGDVRFRTKISADGLKEPVLREESLRIYSDDAPLKAITGFPAPAAPTVKSPAKGPVNAGPTPEVVSPSAPRDLLPTPRVNDEPRTGPIDATPINRVNDPVPIPAPTLPAPGTAIPPPLPMQSVPAPMPPIEIPPPVINQ